MSISIKKAGAYATPVGIFVKKAGAYAAVAGAYAKVGGVYQSVLGAPGPTAPGAPVIGALIAGNAIVTVNWAAPASNGGSAITAYAITLSNGLTASASAGATSQVVSTGNGTAVTATVQAINAVGTGPSSAASNSATPAQPPFAYFSDYNVYVNSAQKALLNEPNRVLGVIKNTSLGPISVLETTEANYQKNPGGSGWQSVPAGQEYTSDTGKTTYVKTYSGTTTSMAYAGGVVAVNQVGHNFVAGQSIYVSGAVPAAYNTATYPNNVVVASVVDANNYTYVPQSAPTGSATTQATVNSIASITIERKVAT